MNIFTQSRVERRGVEAAKQNSMQLENLKFRVYDLFHRSKISKFPIYPHSICVLLKIFMRKFHFSCSLLFSLVNSIHIAPHILNFTSTGFPGNFCIVKISAMFDEYFSASFNRLFYRVHILLLQTHKNRIKFDTRKPIFLWLSSCNW